MVRTGAVVSPTETWKDAWLTFPLRSAAAHDTMWTPSAKVIPEAGEQVIVGDVPPASVAETL